MGGRFVNLPGGFDLRGGQARGAVAAAARENTWIEVARRGIGDETVLQPVARIARGERGLVDDRVLRRRNVAGWFLQHGIGDPERDRRTIRGSTRDAPVVVIREHL